MNKELLKTLGSYYATQILQQGIEVDGSSFSKKEIIDDLKTELVFFIEGTEVQKLKMAIMDARRDGYIEELPEDDEVVNLLMQEDFNLITFTEKGIDLVKEELVKQLRECLTNSLKVLDEIELDETMDVKD